MVRTKLLTDTARNSLSKNIQVNRFVGRPLEIIFRERYLFFGWFQDSFLSISSAVQHRQILETGEQVPRYLKSPEWHQHIHESAQGFELPDHEE